MKTFLKWVVGALMIVAGLTVMFAGVSSFFGGLFFIAAGLICLPPVLPIVEGKLNRKISGLAQLGIVVGCLFIANLLSRDGFKSIESSNKETNTTENIVDQGKEAPPVETQEEKDAKLKSALEKELADDIFTKGLDMDKYGKSTEGANSALSLFRVYANSVERGKQSDNEENKKLASQLEKKLVDLQKKSYPKLRKAFAKAAGDKLWEENVTVAVSGTGNTIITLTGAMFANNKVIKESYGNLEKTLSNFKFKRCQFKWFKYDDEYTYYDIEPSADGELSVY